MTVRGEINTMTAQTIFPLVQVALSIGASAVCFWHGDIRHAIYWIAAAVLVLTVTF